jgi:hypothetical protein
LGINSGRPISLLAWHAAQCALATHCGQEDQLETIVAFNRDTDSSVREAGYALCIKVGEFLVRFSGLIRGCSVGPRSFLLLAMEKVIQIIHFGLGAGA